MDVLEIVVVTLCEFVHESCARDNAQPARLSVLVKPFKTYDVDLTAGLLLERDRHALYGNVGRVSESHVSAEIYLSFGIDSVGIYYGV